LSNDHDETRPADWIKLVIAVGIFCLVFSTLQILQYRALHVPHGDSGMYEEHLWNLLHGKGFRSQLDGGRLFLGEHLQVIHLLLLPIYVLWPTLPTLNVCETLGLGTAAFAVFRCARTLRLPSRAAWTLSAAYLLYFPMQMLDMEASWKTFRPESLAVPFLLWALYALEAKRRFLMLGLLSVPLLAQEEYAVVFAAVGAYVMFRRLKLGAAMIAGAIIYLLFVLEFMIPYFRHGEPPHYTPYFAQLGASPRAIVSHAVTHPGDVIGRLVELRDLHFIALMLLPLAFVPLASPGRFLVAGAVFGYLMLGDPDFLTQPWFHFHGPLVPLLVWATIGGVARLRRRVCPVHAARFVCAACLVTGVWLGRSPLSWSFYDPRAGVPMRPSESGPVFEPLGDYWRDVYLQTPRSRAFGAVYAAVPSDARVAATDYIRTRFTHHGAAHDYPLRPHVSINDIDVIVLDKTEGWWGRGPTNPDRALIDCLADPSATPGTQVDVRGVAFTIMHHDRFFLVVRRLTNAGVD
jgi:uncharacterized membrane protein